MVKKLITQVWEEYPCIVSKLEVAILSEEQALEEDTTILRIAKEFLTRMLLG